ncbi:MAG: acyl-CoA thioesterase [Gemmatimonadales bacterium]|nr:MAG: acyl-CoA thioesterase [Gemmatimonadales bacterium]
MHPEFSSSFRVRSYELDGLGHLNHAVFLNWYEQARFDALEGAGFPPGELAREGWGVHVVRIEVEYRRECRLGDELEVQTRVDEFRNSSMTIRQVMRRGAGAEAGDGGEGGGGGGAGDTREPGELVSEAKVVAVWVGPDGRPMRIPASVREALSEPRTPRRP